MKISQIELCQFRNFSHLYCEFHPETNLIYGENAQGKTNLLEAIAFLSTGKSGRIGKEQDLILFGSAEASVVGTVESQREYQLSAEIFSGKRRRLTKNQVLAKNIGEFSQVLQTVLFCPEDLSLVKEGSLLRRRFLDTAMGQLRPNYNKALIEYRKLYQHKARILRDQSPNLLEALPEFNLRMAQTGAMIIHYRAHFIRRLGEVLPQIHQEFSGGNEEISLEYKTVSTITNPLAGEKAIFQQIMDHQHSHLQPELASGHCLTGPHKDDLLLSMNGVSAKQFASQGQTRTLALSLKLAEREIFFQETEEYPVLLLDDVLSELDKKRQEYVLNHIKTGQVFITCCEESSLLRLQGGASFHIHRGTLLGDGEGCQPNVFATGTEHSPS